MAVYLDDRAVELAGDDLAGVLESAQAMASADQRLIVEVQLDGQLLESDDLDRQRGKDVADADLRLYSAQPRVLAVDTLEQVRGRLVQARTAQEEAADLLQRDQSVEALPKVSESIEAWVQVQNAVRMAAELADVNLDALEVHGQSMAGLTDEMIQSLTDLKAILEANDTVALADALAYEWPELATKWEAVAQAMIEQIEPPSG